MRAKRKYKVTSDVDYKVPDRLTRVVSPKEYDVLKKMNDEGKLDVMGMPKLEHFDEYCKLMEAK